MEITNKGVLSPKEILKFALPNNIQDTDEL